MRSTRALFTFDAGWLYLVAGLALLASLVLVPEQEELENQAHLLQQLNWEERVLSTRMARLSSAHDLLREGDEELHHRLIESRLHQMESGRSVAIVADTVNSPIGGWLDAMGEEPPPVQAAGTPTLLSSLLGSGYRIWILGGATLSIFFGLIMGGAAEPMVMDMARRIIGGGAPLTSEEDADQPHIFAEDQDDIDEDEED